MAYADLDGAHWRPFLAQTVTPDLAKALAWFSVLERHPAITGLSPEHPVARNVARRRAELAAAATPSEGARAAGLAAEASVRRHVESPAIMLSPEAGSTTSRPMPAANPSSTPRAEPARTAG